MSEETLISDGIEEEKLKVAPKAKTVKFQGSLAEYFSDLLITKDNEKSEKEKADILIHTVKTKEDLDGYIDNVDKSKEYLDKAVYVVRDKSIKSAVSLESDLDSFEYYLKTKSITLLSSEEDVIEYYKDVTHEDET